MRFRCTRTKKRILCLIFLLLITYFYAVDFSFRLHGAYVSKSGECGLSEWKYNLTVTAMIRNSGPYLREWLEYHVLVGVEHFYLLDNASDDSTTRELLAEYEQRGLVTHLTWGDTYYR